MNNDDKIRALIDDFNQCALKQIVVSMYVVDKLIPTVQHVFYKHKNRIDIRIKYKNHIESISILKNNF